MEKDSILPNSLQFKGVIWFTSIKYNGSIGIVKAVNPYGKTKFYIANLGTPVEPDILINFLKEGR